MKKKGTRKRNLHGNSLHFCESLFIRKIKMKDEKKNKKKITLWKFKKMIVRLWRKKLSRFTER
jgi:hypothetical protein